MTRGCAIFTIVALISLALLIRVPGLYQPYHQDEYKWAMIVAKGSPIAGTIPHPPLSEGVFTFADRVFGNAHLRMLPFFLSALNLALLYAIVRRRYGTRAAIIAGALYAGTFYSILASLMVDNDGQTLPMFFLLAVYAYDRLNTSVETRLRVRWLVAFCLTMTFGFLTKMSFVIPAGAFALDALIQHRRIIYWKIVGKTAVGFGVGVAFLLIALWNAHYVFPYFDMRTSSQYVTRFFNPFNRQWLQILIQVLKGIMYLSPLLLAPLFLSTRETIFKTRLFWIFSAVAFSFYVVLFDFSGGALDRYLQVFIVPFVIMSAVVLADLVPSGFWRDRHRILACAISAITIFSLQFLPHAVPPQHPKIEWLSRVSHLEWNFLFPFSGGSGPLGFYVSFLLISTSFVVCFVLVAFIRFRPSWKKLSFAALLGVGLAYNVAFTEEYLFGAINGNSAELLRGALAYIESHPEIKDVITYNDTGTYELSGIGKYKKRFYPDAQTHRADYEIVSGHYLFVDIPRLNPEEAHAEFFHTCQPLYMEDSGVISATVYDCPKTRETK